MLAAQADGSGKAGNAVGKLMTKIRQKLCRHAFIQCGKWHHEGKTWHLTGQCAVCDREVFRIYLKDACVERMYEEMQKEKRGKAESRGR